MPGLTSQMCKPSSPVPFAHLLRDQSSALRRKLRATRERTAALREAGDAMVAKFKGSSSPGSNGR